VGNVKQLMYGKEVRAHIINEAEGRGLELKVHIVVGALDECWCELVWRQA
jgi:hypothetical protein